MEKVLVVAITSNKGLCGAFNANIIKHVLHLQRTTFAGKELKVVGIGKKGGEVLSKSTDVVARHDSLYDDLNYENVAAVAQELMKAYEEAEFDKIVLVYNRFKNPATQIVQTEGYLPIAQQPDTEVNSTLHKEYIFEPSQQAIVNELLPKGLKIQLFKAIRDSFAGEHGARMTAMHKATDNATELRDQLKLTYNKARQAAITNEILEIVGGAEALNG